MIVPTAAIWNEDCIPGMAAHLAPDSIDLCVTSIPFGALFQYSGKTEDIGNNTDGIDLRAGQFGLHLRFFIEQLYRVMRPGCNVCVHIQQLLAYKVQHGYMGRRNFLGATIDLFTAGGFEHKGEIVIPKNPQIIAQRLKLHSLMFVTGKRNARDLAPAVNDYVVILQKPGEATPVRCLRDRDTNPEGWVSTDEWISWARGVWADIRETDVLEGWKGGREDDDEKHVCLARGSLVLTYDGYRPIETVHVGDLVLTHEGRWRPVLAVTCNGVRSVIRTRAQGVADLRTTPDHELWVRHVGEYSHTRERAMTITPRWVAAGETLGHYVNLKLPPVEESPYSADDWWLVGRWLGDGHFDTRGRAHITCAREEAPALVGAMGARAGAATARRTAVQIAVNDRGGRLRELLRRCGRGAGGKRLPGEALSLDPEKAEALLSGYLSADGHYVEQHQRWTASSVSRALLLGMALVAQRARGVVASVYAGRPAGTTTIEGRTVHTQADWVLSIPPKNLSGMMLDDGAWKKVRAIEPAGEAEVWDLTVADDASFTAEGCIVHNCPLQLEVVRRLVKLYSNPGETVLDPFAGIGTVPVVAVQEGRHAVGFEIKDSYHALAQRNAQRALDAQRQEQPADLFSLAGVEVG